VDALNRDTPETTEKEAQIITNTAKYQQMLTAHICSFALQMLVTMVTNLNV
jgi:hypothetical protein